MAPCAMLALGESVLSHAALVKEANVLALRLGLSIRCQLGLPPGAPDLALSAHASWLDEPNDSVPDASEAWVRVMDMDSCMVYSWTLKTLERQVQRMHQLSTWSLHTAHNRDARTALLGSAPCTYVPMASVLIPLVDTLDTDMPLRPWWGGASVGACRVRVTHLLQSSAYRITLDGLRDVELLDVTDAHWQLSWHGTAYASQPVHLGLQSWTEVRWQRTLRCQAPVPKYVRAALFVRAGPSLLAHLEAEDQTKEAAALVPGPAGRAWDLVRACPGETMPPQARVHESHRRWRRDVGVHLRIYLQEAVGVRQRAAQVLRSMPGTSWVAYRAPRLVWYVEVVPPLGAEAALLAHMERVCLGPPLTATEHGTTQPVPLQRLPEQDCGNKLALAWDPEHDPSKRTFEATLWVRVTWPDIAACWLTVPVRCNWRSPDVKPAALSWARIDPGPDVVDALFRVSLTPAPAPDATELWRYDTRTMQVQDSEYLGVWYPRGISLVCERLAELQWEHQALEAVHAGRNISAYDPPFQRDDPFKEVRVLSHAAARPLADQRRHTPASLPWHLRADADRPCCQHSAGVAGDPARCTGRYMGACMV